MTLEVAEQVPSQVPPKEDLNPNCEGKNRTATVRGCRKNARLCLPLHRFGRGDLAPTCGARLEFSAPYIPHPG